MAINRGQWGEFLVPGADEVYIDTYEELPSFYNQVLNVMDMDRAFEDDLVATGLPLVVRRHEGEPIAFDRPAFRGKVRYIAGGFGLGYEITEEAVDDNLYAPLNSGAAANLARSHRETEEIVAADVLNLGFTTVQAYDGVSLFNTAHPIVGTGTIANRPDPDVDLSIASLKAALESYWDLRTDRNIRINMAPDRLIVNHNNWLNAQEILGTQVITGAASGGETTNVISDSVPNVITKYGITPVMWRYLTDDSAWFLAPPKSVSRAKFKWRKSPVSVSGFMERERIFWYGIISRFVAGITDWHGWYGSSGTS